jgi:hypothetical protein
LTENYNSSGDLTGHHAIFADKFTELVEKYLEGTTKASKEEFNQMEDEFMKENLKEDKAKTQGFGPVNSESTTGTEVPRLCDDCGRKITSGMAAVYARGKTLCDGCYVRLPVTPAVPNNPGWMCPRCGRINAPYVTTCECPPAMTYI